MSAGRCGVQMAGVPQMAHVGCRCHPSYYSDWFGLVCGRAEQRAPCWMRALCSLAISLLPGRHGVMRAWARCVGSQWALVVGGWCVNRAWASNDSPLSCSNPVKKLRVEVQFKRNSMGGRISAAQRHRAEPERGGSEDCAVRKSSAENHGDQALTSH